MDSKLALQNFIRYRNDPWSFLTECVRTKDEVDAKNPIKLFPDKEYLKLYCKFWKTYPLMAVPKTRRMTMSWVTISLYVWDAIFHKGRFFAFVSKKEDDANELVKRAVFILENLDHTKISKELIPKWHYKFCSLEFQELGSKIQGFPQGADQLRQFTFSGIFGDESAFWENAERFYGASFPTLDGGGRMTLVSSPAPGFFKKLCFDAMSEIGDINVSEYSPDYIQAMQGVRIWKNPKNKFLVFELHYTADPGKRHPEYKESIKNSLPLQEYLREYELHWDTFAGHPVYPEFGKIHITHEKPQPVPGIPMLIGFDFGLTPAAVIGQYEEGVLRIFKELTEINMGIDRFLDTVVIPWIRTNISSHSDLKKNWFCFVDPAGINRSQTDESTCVQSIARYFNPIPGPIAWEERRSAVAKLLMKLEKGEPSFQIYGKDCPILLKGFEGGYRFNEKNVDIEPNKLRPIKDVHSHIHDATQYLCAGISSLNLRTSKAIPVPSYSLKGLKHGQRIL